MHKRRSRSELPHQSDATSSKMCQKCANSHSLESQQVPIENNTWNEREREREREKISYNFTHLILLLWHRLSWGAVVFSWLLLALHTTKKARILLCLDSL